MKTKLSINLMLILSFFFLYNCSSDDSPSNNNNQSNEVEIMQIEDQAESGTWRITSYIDSGQDETNDFNGYNFTFNANGTLMADNGNMTINGNWSVTDDSNSNDDNPSSDIDFNIAFASPPEFAELTDDWDVVSHSNTRIVLIDVSGGNGGTDNLVFERN